MGRISEFAMHFLINAAWQIAAVAIGASICARLLHNVAARYRHPLWLASLVLGLTLPLWGLFNFDFQRNAPRDFGAQRSGAVQAREDSVSASDHSPSPGVGATGHAEGPGLRREGLLQMRRQSV